MYALDNQLALYIEFIYTIIDIENLAYLSEEIREFIIVEQQECEQECCWFGIKLFGIKLSFGSRSSIVVVNIFMP